MLIVLMMLDKVCTRCAHTKCAHIYLGHLTSVHNFFWTFQEFAHICFRLSVSVHIILKVLSREHAYFETKFQEFFKTIGFIYGSLAGACECKRSVLNKFISLLFLL
jgi:hypothetical protein